MIITAFNIETDDLEKSYLVNDYSAGTTTVEVKNSDRISANDRIMIGEMGQEKTEIVTVSAVSGSNLTIGATDYGHSTDEPVYVLTFDQVKFYKASSSGGSFSVIATEDMDVDNINLTTIYDDTTGLSTNYYKFTFYHSISTLESAFSDEIQGSGWRRRQVGKIVDEILQEVSDVQEVHITRNELLGYFNDVNDDLQTQVSRPYDFLKTRTALTRTANTNYLDYPTNSYGEQTMWKFDRMDYNFTDTDTDPDTDNTNTITVITSEELRNLYPNNTIDSTTVTDAKPEHMALDDSVNRFRFSHPFETTTSNVFYLHFWKYFDQIDSEGDEIETPTPRIYKLYGKAMFYRKRSTTEPTFKADADRYMADYIVEKNKYTGINGKDKGSPRSFRPVTSNMRTYRR